MNTALRHLLPLLILALPAAYGINCNRAQSVQEIAICDHPDLKAADDRLTQMYASVRANYPPEAFAMVRADQIEWIKVRDQKCGGDVSCLLQETQSRTALLEEFLVLLAETLVDVQNAPAPKAKNLPPVGENILNPQQIYQVAAQSSVVVLTYQSGRRISQGSGVVLGEDIIATNCHVIEDGDQFAVTFNGEVYEANYLYGNENLDYCILTTQGLPARHAHIATVDTLSPGQRVYSVGSPKGFELTIAEGLISGLRELDENIYMIQTSAAISSGSSGGGLFNEYGEVIGITTLGHKDAENLNFAIPVEVGILLMKDVLDRAGVAQ